MSPKQIVNETLVSDIPLRLLDLKHFPEPEKQTNVFELFKFCQGRIMRAFNDGKKDFEASTPLSFSQSCWCILKSSSVPSSD